MIFFADEVDECIVTDKMGTANCKGSWGDNGDGTFNNPILPGDYSDPDVIRVRNDYFAITSTFQFVPGVTVMHSTDMVNWTILGGAIRDITRISSKYNYDSMIGYGRIVWAPCITYNPGNEKFYIHFCTPDEGLFVVTSTNEGIWNNEWSDLESVTFPDGTALGAGWDDCGVLWDDDGQGYLAANNFKSGYENYLFKISEDGKTLQDNGILIHKTDDGMLLRRGEGNPEAYKIFKKDGYYYFLHNAVVAGSGREVFFLRARNVYGDKENGIAGSFESPGKYEHSQHGVIEKGFREWCQGNIIDTPDNYEGEKKWYFFTHMGSGAAGVGRPVCLVPVEWGDDGFPAAENYKEQWENIVKPLAGSEVKRPQTSDDFSGTKLSPQWMWNYQPKDGMWSLSEKTGHLRLYAYKPLDVNRLDRAGNSLVQRIYATEASVVNTKIDISNMTDGQNAGLQHCSSDVYGAVGVMMNNGSKYICTYGSGGFVSKTADIPDDVNEVYFKSEWGIDMQSVFYYGFDGITYIKAGTYNLQWQKYRGDSVGFFNFNNREESGYIDADYFTYEWDYDLN